jgi:hypothetical protein
MGFTRVEQIRAEVDFGDDERPRRYIRFVVAAIIALVLVGGGYWLGKNT